MTIPLGMISQVADLVLLTVMLLQDITGKSRQQVLDAIMDENIETDELLKRLR